jgi:uncharacterized protein YecT (DUF1311 family)
MIWRLWPLTMFAAAMLLTGPAAAFDCGKASTEVEKAICANPKLKAADDDMTAAYVKLRDGSDANDKDSLRISQLRWIKRREGCDDDTVENLNACIGDETAKRKAVLTALPVSGNDEGSDLIPWFIQKEGKNGGWDIDLDLVRFAEPYSQGEELFNREAGALAFPSLIENSTLNTSTLKVEKDRIYAHAVSLSPTYASKSLISALAEGFDDTGGAHGNSWRRAINISLDEGRRLTFGDLFPREATGLIAKRCNDQLVTARKVRTEDKTMDLEEGADIVVLAHVKDLERWAFWADHAAIMFDPYEIGSYAEGPYSCELDMTMLRTLANAGAPLPK